MNKVPSNHTSRAKLSLFQNLSKFKIEKFVSNKLSSLYAMSLCLLPVSPAVALGFTNFVRTGSSFCWTPHP